MNEAIPGQRVGLRKTATGIRDRATTPEHGGAMAHTKSTIRRLRNVRARLPFEERKRLASNAARMHAWILCSMKPCSSSNQLPQRPLLTTIVASLSTVMIPPMRVTKTLPGVATRRTTVVTSVTARKPCVGCSTRAGSFDAGSGVGTALEPPHRAHVGCTRAREVYRRHTGGRAARSTRNAA